MNIQHIMVVVDPTSEGDQPCVHRAQQLLQYYPRARVTLFVCDYASALDGGFLFDTAALAKGRASLLGHREVQLDQLAQPLRDMGVTVNTMAIWGKRFERHILHAISEQQPDLVIKTTHRHNLLKRLNLNNTDWYLIRHCPVPLWLVKQPDTPLDNFCASVDPMHEADKPAALDFKLVDITRSLAHATSGQMQVVHCYNPLPQTLAFDAGLVADYDGYATAVRAHHAAAFDAFSDQAAIDQQQRHLLHGYPEQTIPEFIEQNRISLLVIGAISRSRLESALVGHTAERLLDDVPCDLLIVKPNGFIDPSQPA